MGLYDRLSDWPPSAIDIVSRCIPNYKSIFILGQSVSFKYTSTYCFTESETVVISYNRLYHVFVAWNAHIHNHIHSKSDKKVLSAAYPKEGVLSDEIKCIYQYRNSHGNEKIAFIGEEALFEFCLNFDYYLTPKPEDSGYRSPALYVNDKDELVLCKP